MIRDLLFEEEIRETEKAELSIMLEVFLTFCSLI